MNGWLKPLKKKKICSTRGGCFIDHDSYSELKILGKQGAETIIDALLKKKNNEKNIAWRTWLTVTNNKTLNFIQKSQKLLL